ncbi:hypothetical protein C0992_009319 [Termitomyces sp. T32_za158]|nr:hypothetical protein C0992_009319 [Termitomyces sp. T32_za158]
MVISSKLAREHVNNLYGNVENSIIAIAGLFLGTARYRSSFHHQVEQWSGNYAFKDTIGGDFRMNIVGEIAPSDAETIIAAKGNHYAGRPGDPVRLLGNDSKAKDVLSIKMPTECLSKLKTLFYNQIQTLDSIKTSNKKEEMANGSNPNRLLYSTTRSRKCSVSNVTSDNDLINTLSLNGDTLIQVLEVGENGFYNPRLNDNYWGPYFNLVCNKLIQLDVRNCDNNLIAPWRFYDALKPGSLESEKTIERVVPRLPGYGNDQNGVGKGVSAAVDAFTNFALFKRRKLKNVNERTGEVDAACALDVQQQSVPQLGSKIVLPRKREVTRGKKAKQVEADNVMQL